MIITEVTINNKFKKMLLDADFLKILLIKLKNRKEFSSIHWVFYQEKPEDDVRLLLSRKTAEWWKMVGGVWISPDCSNDFQLTNDGV